MRTIISILAAAWLLASCNPDKEKETNAPATDALVQVRFETRVGEQDFALGAVYTDHNGYRFRLENFRTYLSMISLINTNGDSVVLRDFFVGDMHQPPALEQRVPAGNYEKIRFYVGVPANYNRNVDPTTYPNSHPLSIQGSQGMFWTWNTGYIFTKFDGKADLQGQAGNPLLHAFAFHAGDDQLLRIIELPISQGGIVAGTNRTFTVQLQINDILGNANDPIDLSVDYLTHTGGNFLLARRFMDNFSTAFSLTE